MTRAIAVLLALAGCDPDLERMIDQPRFSSYEECDVCPDDTIMMQPPVGTVSRTALLGPPEVVQGRVNNAWMTRVPIAIDREALARGRDRFNIFCAACHGRLGNGLSQVAENMTLRAPPNLISAPYADYPPGRVFAIITQGYGLMRSYAGDLPVMDRWAVVAYLDALELAQDVALAELPAHSQEEARRWLK